jgi:hypothetical protein
MLVELRTIRQMQHSENRDKYVSESFNNLRPLFLMQAAADPKHPNILVPPTPPLDLGLYNSEKAAVKNVEELHLVGAKLL